MYSKQYVYIVNKNNRRRYYININLNMLPNYINIATLLVFRYIVCT